MIVYEKRTHTHTHTHTRTYVDAAAACRVSPYGREVALFVFSGCVHSQLGHGIAACLVEVDGGVVSGGLAAEKRAAKGVQVLCHGRLIEVY